MWRILLSGGCEHFPRPDVTGGRELVSWSEGYLISGTAELEIAVNLFQLCSGRGRYRRLLVPT
jgi:hypothetical protein